MTSPRVVGWICALQQLINSSRHVISRGHVSATRWGTYKYMNIQLLKEMDNEAIYSAA